MFAMCLLSNRSQMMSKFGKNQKVKLKPLGPVTTYIIFLLYLTIIPWVRVGYEMIDSQRGT